jgi:hypothetical protein
MPHLMRFGRGLFSGATWQDMFLPFCGGTGWFVPVIRQEHGPLRPEGGLLLPGVQLTC